MEKKFDWNILDHRWNNFKAWFKCMEKRRDKPIVLISDLRKMINYVDTTSDKIWEIKSMEALQKNNLK